VNSLQLFKIVDGVQRALQYLYMIFIGLSVYVVISKFMTGTEIWVRPMLRGLTAIELFFVIIYFGLKIATQIFSRIDGEFLGTEVYHMIEFWEWLENKVKNILIYNGILGFVMFSLYL